MGNLRSRRGRKLRATINDVHLDIRSPRESEFCSNLLLKVEVLAKYLDELAFEKGILLRIEAHIATRMAALLDRHFSEKGQKDARKQGARGCECHASYPLLPSPEGGAVMPVTRRPVVISAQSVTEGAASIVLSNVSIVNACLDDLLTQDELSIQALRSYYVDYFQAQVDNGGFTQFVYNSRASDTVAQLVHDGLVAMGAQLHVSAFDEGARLLKEAGRRGRDALLATDYGSSSRLRTRLAKLSPTFDRARAAENLTEFNARWLLADPDVVVLPRDQIEAHIAASVAMIPDIDDRR